MNPNIITTAIPIFTENIPTNLYDSCKPYLKINSLFDIHNANNPLNIERAPISTPTHVKTIVL